LVNNLLPIEILCERESRDQSMSLTQLSNPVSSTDNGDFHCFHILCTYDYGGYTLEGLSGG